MREGSVFVIFVKCTKNLKNEICVNCNLQKYVFRENKFYIKAQNKKIENEVFIFPILHSSKNIFTIYFIILSLKNE